MSAGLAAVGYLSFALILAKASPDTPFVHLWLTAAYFLVGSATVGSYFAALTCGKSCSLRYGRGTGYSLCRLTRLLRPNLSSMQYIVVDIQPLYHSHLTRHYPSPSLYRSSPSHPLSSPPSLTSHTSSPPLANSTLSNS